MTRRGRVRETAMLRTKEGRKNLHRIGIKFDPEFIALLQANGLTVEDALKHLLTFLKNMGATNEKTI